MSAKCPSLLAGRYYDHFFVRGNTLVSIPSCKDNPNEPLAVTTWVVEDIHQGMQQALVEKILDDTTFETIEKILISAFTGVYIDRDYICPSILTPNRSAHIRCMFNELTPPCTWSWEGWLSLEADMNRTGVKHGFDNSTNLTIGERFGEVTNTTVTAVEEDDTILGTIGVFDDFVLGRITSVTDWKDCLSELSV